MNIISRYNDKILKKKEDGLYIIEYNNKPQRKIITEDYNSRDIVTEKYKFSKPIDEVKSFDEVQSIFYLESETSKSNVLYKKITIALIGLILIYLSIQYSLVYSIYLLIIGVIITYIYNYFSKETSYL